MTEPIDRPHLVAEVTLRSTDQGGRRAGLASGYRPNAVLTGAPELRSSPHGQAAELWGCELHLDVGTLEPGETARARVYPFHPEGWVRLRPGDLVGIYEGLRLVGSLQVRAPIGTMFVDVVAGFAARERDNLTARGISLRSGSSPEDVDKTSAWVALERLPHVTADLAVWDTGEAELGAAWTQQADGWTGVVSEHRDFTTVEQVRLALDGLVELVAANPRGHGLPPEFVPRNDAEARYLTGVLGWVPDLDVWPHVDAAGPWLLLSLDLVARGGVRDVARVDFDGTSIMGGWSPAFLNWDAEMRAPEAGLGPEMPDWVSVSGAPDALAAATVAWFLDVTERWPRQRGVGWLGSPR